MSTYLLAAGQSVQCPGMQTSWLRGLVALGLIAYGIHMGLQARYRRISPR